MKVLIALALAALAPAGCTPPPETAWQSRGDRVLGLGSDLAEDPVTGTLVEKKGSVRRDYRGTTYYFESGDSAAMFDVNPSVYAVGETLPPREHTDREAR